jgi:hypothetical protein
MFANTQAGGTCNGFPDVCLTPAPPAPSPVPIPYPNIASGPMAISAVYTVLISSAPAHNMGTTIPMTSGDNPGVALGVASGLVMGKATPTTGAFKVLIGGKPATRLTMTSMGNGTNCPTDTRLAPSQTKVLILGG